MILVTRYLLLNAMSTLYVIAAASGAGKTSLVKALVEAEPGHHRVSVAYHACQSSR